MVQVVPVWVPKNLGCTDDHQIGQLVGQLFGQLIERPYPLILTARESKDAKYSSSQIDETPAGYRTSDALMTPSDAFFGPLASRKAA